MSQQLRVLRWIHDLNPEFPAFAMTFTGGSPVSAPPDGLT